MFVWPVISNKCSYDDIASQQRQCLAVLKRLWFDPFPLWQILFRIFPFFLFFNVLSQWMSLLNKWLDNSVNKWLKKSVRFWSKSPEHKGCFFVFFCPSPALSFSGSVQQLTPTEKYCNTKHAPCLIYFLQVTRFRVESLRLLRSRLPKEPHWGGKHTLTV